MSRFDYNVIVIGAGSAGLVAAYIAAAVKARVALIERDKMGGDCLNTGCVPSKALLRTAKIVSYARRAEEFGLDNIQVDVDFSRVMQRVQRIIEAVAPHDSVERYSKLGVECISGSGRIVGPHEVEVDGKRLRARAIIVATGGRPRIPDVSGLQGIPYLTSDTVWALRSKPSNLLVLGGGPIGCELAQGFSRLGVSVKLVTRAQRLLPREDDDVSAVLEKQFASENIKVLTGHEIKEFKDNVLICSHNNTRVELNFDKVLLALGRSANVDGFGLQELGIEIRNDGTIQANPFLQTNVPSIYVCGDVTGPYQFTHTASHQAWYASVNALFTPFKRFKVDYRVIPWATFVDPEVARVGLNELQARQQNIPYEVSRYDISDLDRAIAEGEARGFIKVLTKPGNDKILGVTLVGEHAGELISEYIAAMKHNIGLNKILGTIHIYPTMSEANKYVAGVWKKTHAPQGLLKLVQKFHAWRRG